jgi:hypothetical protein
VVVFGCQISWILDDFGFGFEIDVLLDLLDDEGHLSGPLCFVVLFWRNFWKV